MSFTFPSWSTAFSPSFHNDAKAMLQSALNKGSKPPIIKGDVEVVDLSMGKQPPTLALLEIGDLSPERFRGIFRLGYQGDASMVIKAVISANPLSHNPHLSSNSTLPLNAPLIASQPLLVPMTLRLSSLKLRAILILVVSKSKGITLVFKNDPLQNVEVSSTFDSIEVIRGYLQKEIEGQLREMFREDLPVIIHRLSQQWFAGTGVGGRVEMPYRDESIVKTTVEDDAEPPFDPSNPFGTSPSRSSYTREAESLVAASPSHRRRSSRTLAERKSFSTIEESPSTFSTFPETERYDPTYGLRPEGLPTHSGYESFGKLFDKAKEGKRKGLGSLMDLAEEVALGSDLDNNYDHSDEEYDDPGDVSEDSEDLDGSVEAVDESPALRSRPYRLDYSSRMPSSQSVRSHQTSRQGHVTEYETIPAVGGGMTSRPRIFHVQSQIRAPSESGFPSSGSYGPLGTQANGTAGSVTARASSVRSSFGGSQSGLQDARSMLGHGRQRAGRSRVDTLQSINTRPDLMRQHSRADSVPALSAAAQSNRNSVAYAAISNRSNLAGSTTDGDRSRPAGMHQRSMTAQPMDIKPHPLARHPIPKFVTPPRPRRSSLSQNPALPGSPPAWPVTAPHNKSNQIVVPLNESVSQLATLYHSNHTLSPYARSHEHVAVRSFPHLSRTSSLYSAPTSTQSPLSGMQMTMAYSERPPPMVRGQRKRIYRLNSQSRGEDQFGGGGGG